VANYELTVILRNNEVESLKDKVKGILEKHSASITLEDPWGVKRLAYKIDGEKEGYYYFMHIDSPAEAVQKIIRDFGLNSDILRHLFVKTKKSS